MYVYIYVYISTYVTVTFLVPTLQPPKCCELQLECLEAVSTLSSKPYLMIRKLPIGP